MIGKPRVALLREQHYSELYLQIQETLQEYLNTAKLTNKNGWQLQVENYLITLPTYNAHKSLIGLRESLLKFCEELVHPTKQLSEVIVGKTITGTFEWFLGATGSTLKEKLSALATRYNPYDLAYFFDELRNNPHCSLQPNGKIEITDWELISLDMRIILETVRQDHKQLSQLMSYSNLHMLFDECTELCTAYNSQSHEEFKSKIMSRIKYGKKNNI